MAVKLCSKCHPLGHICDFCKHYQFNGINTGSKHGLAYNSQGCCSLHFLRAHPEHGCEYFYCDWADGEVKTQQK